MASFHAELHLAGASYRVVRCHYACHQPTDARGRVNAKVRHELLHLTLDVPDDDALLAWAAAPFKTLAGEVVFYDATRLVAHETIAFAGGQCVGYHESFASGAAGDGAYVCQLTITAPEFELRSGGPAALAAIMATVANAPTSITALPAPGLVSAPLASLSPDAWLVDLETVVGSSDVRTMIATWVAGGLSEAKLAAAIGRSTNQLLLFERLRDANKGIFQQRVVIDDYDEIPGVTAKTYVANGLPEVSIAADLFGVADSSYDLPKENAPTFTDYAELVELNPGDKLYRVTNDPSTSKYAMTGGYWTRTPPAALADVIGGTAVMPEWNNFQRVYELTVPPHDPTTGGLPKLYAWEGPTAAQPVSGEYKEKKDNGYCLAGGEMQAFLPNNITRHPAFKNHIKDLTPLHKSW